MTRRSRQSLPYPSQRRALRVPKVAPPPPASLDLDDVAAYFLLPWTVWSDGTERTVTKKNRGEIVYPGLSRFGDLPGFLGHLVKLLEGGQGSAALGTIRSAISSQRHRPKLLPNEEYRRAAEVLVPEISRQWRRRRALPKVPMCVSALFYLPARSSPDLLSLEQALADLLEAAGVVTNDYWIQSWDGSTMFRDTDNPRAEVWIRPIRRT